MKKSAFLKAILLTFISLQSFVFYGQNIVPFTKRFNQQVKGDMLVIGNSTLGTNSVVNNNSVNEAISMQFIDIDGDATTFSSSSANLAVPPATTCFRIAYAGLYWGALIKTEDSRTKISNVKLKLPGSTVYNNITGTVIYDAVVAPIAPDSNKPYACYADVTALVSGLTNAQGTYTVADVSSSIGFNGSTGLSAGWTLVVIYEDPTATTKSITTFDGFSAIFDSSSLDINVSGFITPPSGSVDIKFGFAALNGDRPAKTRVEVGNSFSNGDPINTNQRGPSNNFFNSSITDVNGYITARNPNVNNTLGYDTGTVAIKDASKVGNNATSAVVSLQIPKGQANTLFSFFNSFLINVVAPDISLTKIVQDGAGKDVGNTTINLGQDLYYKIDFQNIGNDQITAFTLEDLIPNNVIFNYPSDIVLPLPAGVTHTYDAVARRLVFTIPDNIVNIGDPINTIRLHVKVVSDYNLLRDACSNEIKNQAFANYRGVVNTTPVKGEGSFASTVCNFGLGSSTNFLANINDHTFTRTQVLCGNDILLSASNGYGSYSWSRNPTGSPVISTSQTFTATSTGTYYVNSVSNSTCKSIKEEITVIPFGNTITNPVSPYADEEVTCPNNGKSLPNIFLCGANATRLIQTNITGVTLEWQKLNEASCPSTAFANCANENYADLCWNKVATSQNYSADTAGQFRVVLKYEGGCRSIFYFNVYKNMLNPTVTTNDIICTTSGKITVGGVPPGYEYSRDNMNYQSSNIFTTDTAGTYTVYIRQVGVTTNPCIFEVKDILIRLRNFTVSKITTQPLCNGGFGSIRLVANDVRSQYFFSISKGGTLVDSKENILANEAIFSNLAAGVYTYEVRTEDGCIETGSVELFNPAKVTATAAVTKQLTCANGEITVYPSGGTPPYKYFVNSTTVSQTVPQIVVSKPLPAGGVFNITVVDVNNCSTTTSVTVAEIPKPEYTVTKTDINCYGVNSGEIRFNVTNTNGYSLRYSINNGTSYSTNPTFSNLPAGTYTPVLEYSLSEQVCTDLGAPISIIEPASAATASGGVSKLAGCTLSNKGGTIRFSNVSGGTSGYTYSFDGGATFGTATEKDVLPGSYTLVVRDSRNCTFTIPYPVTLDPIPTAPTILADTSSFNCDGTGTTTITVTNPSNLNYQYGYLIDGVLNPNTADPKVFLNVSPGTHIVRVEYKLVSVPTFSNLLFEDFGKGGYTTTPGINPAYCFEDESTPHPPGFPCGDINDYQINDGKYAVASSIKTTFGVWITAKDHTLPLDPLGRFLCVNVGGTAGIGGVLYSKAIKNIIPFQDVKVSIWAENLIKKTLPDIGDPDLTIQLWKDYGLPTAVQVGASVNTGRIPKSENWENYILSINPGNNTDLTFLVRSNSTVINGNDVLIDDINVFQLPETCIAQKDFSIEVPTGKAFEAQITGSKNITCSGFANGEITIAAQNFDAATGFQYSTNNGATWFTTTTSPVTVSGLDVNTYSVIVSPNADAVGTCSKPFSVVITEPEAVAVTALRIAEATCSTGATIRATGSGGTPAYLYELREADGTTFVRAFNNNTDFTNVPVGTYTVFVRDANACTNATGFPITVDAPPTLTATLDAATDYCYTVANPATLVVNVSGGVGPFTYALDGNASISSASTTFSFPNVTPGTHTILVTDSNNCTSTISNIVIAPAVTFNVSLLQDLTCFDDASIGNEVITGGYGTQYMYSVSYNSGPATTVASFPYTATVAGTYVFTVSDSKGCPATSNTITVTPKTTPTHTTTKTDITCNNDNNGTIAVTASGGFTSAYTYVLTGPIPTVTQTTNLFTNLSAGNYTVNVIDSKGCPSPPTQVNILNPTPIATNATATAFSCNSTTNANQSATITVVPTGGTGTYTYSYDNGANFGSNSTLIVNDNGTTQTIRIVVKDANGCLSPVQIITLQPLNPPSNLDFSNLAVTCTATTTTVSVTATNGVGALKFIITGTTSATASTNFGPITTTGSAQAASFPNLLPGNYTFKVTDANGCFYSESYTIAPVTPIAIAGNKTSDVLCKGQSTGSGVYTVSGNATVGAYTFVLTSGTLGTGGTLTQSGNTLTLANVAVGTYVVRVTDTATGCFADGTIVIAEPANTLSITSATPTNVSCNNDNSTITIVAAGGTPNFTYAAVVAGAIAPTIYAASNLVVVNTNSATNLSWDVYVKDANGCVTLRNITIISDPLPGLTVAVDNQCSGSGSTFTITATPTAASLTPVTYGIGGPTGTFQTSPTFSVPAGTYTVSIKDKNGCITAASPIQVYPRLTAAAVVTKTLDCSSAPDAVITTTITGGRAPFTYTVQKGSGAPSAPSTASAAVTFTTSVGNANANTYTFVITDANGCPTTTSTTVAPITDPTVTATQVNVSCNAGSDGSVTLTGAGGSGGYTYSNNATSGFTTNATFTNLAAGTYTFYVKDSKGCVGSVVVNITQPTAVTFTSSATAFTCSTTNAKQSATITVAPTGGTGTYTYSYNNAGTFVPSNTLTVNDNGTTQSFQIIVKDANGCLSPVQTITLAPLNKPTDLAFTNAVVTCTATTTTVSVTATNGVGALTFIITGTTSATASTNFGPISTTGSAQAASFPNLLPGNYTFRVTDANGCFYSESYTIAPVTPIAIAGNKTSDVLCKGQSTGSGAYTVSGNATIGAYTFVLTSGALGTGGTLTQSGNTLTLANVAVGTYVVRVTDTATGCFADGTIIIGEPANALRITSATPTNVSCNNTNSTITIVAAGGTPNYTYAAVVTGATAPTIYAASNLVVVDTNSATNLSWDVYVKDANGCVTMKNVTIINDPLPGLTVAVDNQCSGSGSTFTITATPTAASLTPVTYGIGGPTGTFQTSPTFSVPAGTYTVSIKDKNGCIMAASPIIVYPRLTAAAVVTKTLDCSSAPDAVITTTITGGRAPFTYTVQKGSGATSASTPIAGTTFTTSVGNANADTYTFVITDANGCPTTTSTTVAPITDPTVTATQVNISCNAGADGSATLTGSGGSGGYLYSNNATSGFTTNATFTNLAAGTYTFYVKDSKGCVGSVVVNITQPTNALVATAVTIPFSCSATNAKVAGTFTINVTTGTGTAPYTYSFKGGEFTSSNVLTLNDNGADQPYTYTVRDAKGCTISGTGTLERLNPPTDLTFAPSGPITCLVTDISVQLTTINGVTPLTYTIVSGPITNTSGATSGNFTGLTPGTYVFRVTDANGCFYSESYTIAPVTPIVATATKLTDVDCRGNTTGSIRYGVSGFSSGYSYTVNGGTPVTGQTASTFTLPNLGADTYNVVFTDNFTGCTASTSVIINQPAVALSATYTTVNANCNVPTSNVTVTVAGVTSSFRYSFVTSSTTPGTYGTNNVANLNPTTSTSWYAHIIDANNCTFVLPITIAKDPIPTVTAAGLGCLGTPGGYTITANNTTTPSSGIINPITYSINNGASYQSGKTFTVTTAGTYTITMKDGNGCIATAAVVTVNPQLTLTAVLNKDITCSLPTDAQITLTPTGGSGSFTYEFMESTSTYVAMASNILNTNNTGSYTFKVTDTATGCQAVTTTAIVISAPIDPYITQVTQTAFSKCKGDDTGAIAIAIDNTKGQSPFVFNVQRTAPTTQNYSTQTSGLAAGDYLITVTDAKGCTNTKMITIFESPAIIVKHTSTPITCNSSTGQSKGSVIVQSVTGGVGPYNYFVTGINGYNNSELNNLGTTSVAFNVVDFGLYQINVVDANGCSVLIQDVPVASPPDDLDISVVPVGPTCVGLGSVEVGIGSKSSITGNGPFHFAVYSPGLTYSGSTSPPWYDEDAPNSKKATIPNLIPGVTYTFIVHDQLTGCYYFETADVPIPTNSTITVNPLIPNNIKCKGAADGNVTFTIIHAYGVATPVTYQIYKSQSVTPVGSVVSATIPASGSLVVSNFGMLPFGKYFVLVTEDTGATNAGCSISSAPFNITESAIDLSITAQKIKKINCNENGIIAAFAKDGTAPYTYQYLLDTVTGPVASSSGWIPNTTFATSIAGNYIVYVKDAYGCIKSAPITLDADAPPTITAPASICYQRNPFTITISGTVDPDIVGAPTYSINGSAFKSSPSFTFNAAGTYNLVIKDGNGCTANVNYVVYPQLVSSAALTKPLDCTTSPNAIITLTTTGGNPAPTPANYTYQVSFNGAPNVASTNPYTATGPGTYMFTITDANNANACTTTASITLDPIPTTVFNTTQTAVSCNGGADGTISVTVTAGEGPYEYQLDSGIFQTSNVFTGLSAGSTYVVTVRNARQCLVSSVPITISEPALLTATAGFTANTTCSPTTVITVIPAGGNGGYLFNLNGLGYTTANTYTVNNLTTATTVNYTVKDAKGCETASQAVITPALNPATDLTFTVTTAPTCPANTATVQVAATGGVGTLAYAILSPASATGNSSGASSGVFTTLAPEDYMFQVTDANGCSYQELYTINQVTPIAIVGSLINNITCNVANGITNNGSARFTVTGFSSTGNYSINVTSVPAALPFTQLPPVGDVITFTGLNAGTYTVTVTDNTTLCVANASVTITVPAPIAFTTAATKVFCSQDISKITVSAVTGGTGVYQYAVLPGGTATPPAVGAYSNNPVLSVDTNLTNLSWDVYVKYANSCIAMQNVIVVSDALPTIVVPAAQCFEGTALTVDLSTLTTTYNPTRIYTLNGVVLATSTATFTAAGTYVLGIRDDNGCEAFVTYTIENQLLANAILTKDLYCAGAVNATIEVTISGGVGTYTVQTNLNGAPTGTPVSGVTGPVYTASVATVGTYTFTITDSNAAVCDVISNLVEVTTPATPAFTTTFTNATCNGDSNGTITVTPFNGVAPYTFDLSGAGSNTTGDANGFYTGLPAGSYTVVITDSKGCTSLAATAITIAEPAVVSATISVTTPLSCGTGNATQSATVKAVGAGGNGPYQYNFNNQGFSANDTFVTNTSGTVSVIARDANGCTFATAVSNTVVALNPPTNMNFSSTPIYCAPTSSTTSAVTITTTNGVGPLTYAILSPASATSNTTGASSGIFTTLAPGDYMFQVTDANGCTYQELYTVNPVTLIAIVGALVNDITCNAANAVTNNGSASFTVTGFSSTGNYSINVTSVPAALPFTQLPPVGDVITLTGLNSGTYTVTVTDNTTLCVANASVTITVPAPITFTPTATKVFCSQDISQITVSAVTGGTGAYTYAVLPGGTVTPPAVGAYGNSPVLSVDTNLTNLSWDVYVKDANGCIAMQNVTVVSNAPPKIVAPAAQCFEGTALTVNLNTITTTYNPTKIYTLNGVVLASSTATFTAAGTYVLGIRDDNGCEAFVNYTIVNQLLANAILTKDLYCAGAVNATIEITISGGVAPYTVQTNLNGAPAGTPVSGVAGPVYTASVATVGTYTFTITDSNAAVCDVISNSVEVTTPATPVFTTTFTDATCNGDSNGTITVTPSNGVAPYTFDLSGAGSNITGDANGVYTGLAAGSYTIVITDSKGCTSLTATAITIAEPAVVSATISVTTALSCGAGNATQSATVTAVGAGGNGSYQYNFNNQGFTPSNTFVTNTAGPVSVIAKDANGCSFAVAVSTTVNALNPPTNMDISGTLIYCAPATSTTSTVTINSVTAGVAQLTYQILSPAASIIDNGINNVFTSLTAGDYLFQVTDNNGCTYKELCTVAPRVNIAVTVASSTDETCFNSNNGTATFTVSNSSGYTATLTVGTGTPVIAGNTVSLTALAPGNYTLQVTDTATGCPADVIFVIAEIVTALDFTSTATNTNCNTDMATIKVVASGGTVNYKYVAVIAGSTAPGATAYGSSPTLVVNTNGGVDMNWIVYVMDANDCLINKPQTIVPDARPTIASAVATQCPSPTGTYTITVTATGFSSALEYSAGGGNFQIGKVITVNAPGPYTITVRDANGCISLPTNVIIADPLILTPVVTTPVSCTGNDGQISVSTTGGSGNYVYNIDGVGGFALVTSFSNLASGPHRITVRDITLCEVFVDVNLQAATLITGFAFSKTDVTCNGGTDGTITATLATPDSGINDNPVYLYSLNGRTPQDSPLFSGLAAGTYNVIVTSGRGCSESLNIDVIEPTLIIVPAPTVVQFGCTTGNIGNLATITVTGVTGGTTPYLNYEFIKVGPTSTQVYLGPNNAYTEANLLGGSYFVSVYDSKGCVGTTTTPITIAPYIALDKVNVEINQKITCTNLENITITATTVGVGTATLEYTIVGVTYDPTTAAPIYGAIRPAETYRSGLFTDLVVGDYLITIKNLDTKCEIKGVHYVNEPNTFDLTIDEVVNVICFGGINGSANVTFVDRYLTTTPPNGDDAGAFTYTLKNSLGNVLKVGTSLDAGPFPITGLAAGTYTITATLSQSPDCSVTRNFTIAGPSAALDLTESYTDITCLGNDGTISVAATGGWPGGYEFELTGSMTVAYSAQSTFTNLTAGPYTINVRDSKGCVATTTVTLVIPTPINVTASADITLLSCMRDKNATITVDLPTGGQGSNYLYTLNTTSVTPPTASGPQVSPIFSGLGAGTYSITVTDGYSCSATSAAIVIDEPTEVKSDLVVATIQTCLTQTSLTLSATGGTGLYTYSDTAAFTTILGSFASSVTFPLPVGTYVYYVRDANGCVADVSNQIKIDPLLALVINLDKTNAVINCAGDDTGFIVATAQGGLSNYIYTLQDAAGNTLTTVQASPGVFTQLFAGNYQVKVDSGDCTTTSSIITITQPLAPLAAPYTTKDVTCNGSNNGSIEINASGGTGIIKYAISPNLNQFFDTNIFDRLAPGNYDVIIQDVLGCYVKINFDITEPAPIVASTISGTILPEICFGDKDGAFMIDVTGGVLPYGVSLDNPNGTYTTGTATQTQFDFIGLTGGTHTIYIRDDNGCDIDWTIALPESIKINPIAVVDYSCVNNSATNTVTVTVDASIRNPADLDYSLDGTPYQASNVFTNVAPGVNHFIDVRHTNGCIQRTMNFDIAQIDPLAITLNDGGLNEIVAVTTGGAGGNQYTLNGESYGTKSSFIVYESGDYTVEVTDTNGCSATASRYFEFIDIKIPNVFTPNGDGNNDWWGPSKTINYPDLVFDIYDRYGRKIATYKEGQYWDGKYNSLELPSGDYWYVLKLQNNKDAREFVGHFTLYR